MNVSDATAALPKSGDDTGRANPAFDHLAYWIYAQKSGFDVSGFRRYMPEDADDIVTAAPRDEVNGPYSVLFSWTESAEAFTFIVTYYSVPWKHEPGEQEPYAEEFMNWLGQFFSEPSVRCHLHARFSFDLSARRSTFPLQLAEPLPWGARLDGVSLTLPKNPQGAESVRMTRGEAAWYAEVVSEREITFAEFTPYPHVNAALSVLGLFLVESRL